MKSLKVGRYNTEPTATPIRQFSGWIEPDDRRWIIFLGPDGAPALYWAKREKSGAVVGKAVVM